MMTEDVEAALCALEEQLTGLTSVAEQLETRVEAIVEGPELGTLSLSEDEMVALIVGAVDYHAGRSTYASGTISRLISRNWESLPASVRKLVAERLKEKVSALVNDPFALGTPGVDAGSWIQLFALAQYGHTAPPPE